jgi:hypothetical protein
MEMKEPWRILERGSPEKIRGRKKSLGPQESWKLKECIQERYSIESRQKACKDISREGELRIGEIVHVLLKIAKDLRANLPMLFFRGS